jgi:predicted subunit of tRNA(5-methylaminomethyl-2-thiouridylate) methyltransferase
MTIRALSLLSGGLDSTLAIKVLQKAGVRVTAISFISHFFGSAKAKIAAKKVGVELIEYDFKDEHFEMVKKPVYGYGQNMNPCIDCHALMFKKAGEIMKKEGYDFLSSGEVLGQRPKSQTKQALKSVEKLSGMGGYIVRPMSGQLLDETIPEKEGKIDRNKLLNISGKSRKPQMALADKWGITDYPSPAGGCLLTDKNFSDKLRELLEKIKDPDIESINLLKIGRHFWSNDNKIVIGRDKEECLEKLPQLASKDDVLLELVDRKGPLTLIHGKKVDDKAIADAAELTKKYSKAKDLGKVKIRIKHKDQEKIIEI